LARATVQLFVPIDLLRKQTEEAVAVLGKSLESSEATTQVGVVDWRRCWALAGRRLQRRALAL
jgi:hypothetical protein